MPDSTCSMSKKMHWSQDSVTRSQKVRRGCTFGGVYVPCILTGMPPGGTVGKSDLCCCIPCLSSAIDSLSLLISHQITRFGAERQPNPRNRTLSQSSFQLSVFNHRANNQLADECKEVNRRVSTTEPLAQWSDVL